MSNASYETAHNEHINRYKMSHMIGVAEYMRERAKDYSLDGDTMYAVGLLHDIGYIGGRAGHEEYGAYLLRNLNVREDVVFAVEHHGENLRELEARFGKDVMTASFILIMEADASINAQGYRVGFDGRLADIESRYGKDSIAYKTVCDNIEYIKEYQCEHGIGKPIDLYHKRNKDNDRSHTNYRESGELQ